MPSVYYFDHIFDTLLQRPVQGLMFKGWVILKTVICQTKCCKAEITKELLLVQK